MIKIEVVSHIIGLNIEETFQAPFIKNYAVFLSAGLPEIFLDVKLSPDVPALDSSEPRLEYHDRLINIVSDYLVGSLDLKTKCGKVKLNPQYFLQSLGTFLRNMFTLLVPLEDNGIVLHAAGIVRDEEVYIFIGPSRAGKTTVAKLSEGKVILSDDLVLMKKIDNEFMVFPTPDWGDKQIGQRENRPHRINSMFRLIKDKVVYLEEFSPAHSLADIFTIPHIETGLIPKDVLLVRFLELISAVPYYRLHFLPEPSFWDCIEEKRMKDGVKRKNTGQIQQDCLEGNR